MVSADVRQGYGPEAYQLRQAASGTYDVGCKYFGSRRQTLLGPTTLVATVYLDWGRPTQRAQQLVARLDRTGDNIRIGSVQVGGGAVPAKPGQPPVAVATVPVSGAAISALRIGTNRQALISQFGVPLREESGAITTVIYRLDNGNEVKLGLAPDLMWAREQIPGGEKDLIAAR